MEILHDNLEKIRLMLDDGDVENALLAMRQLEEDFQIGISTDLTLYSSQYKTNARDFKKMILTVDQYKSFDTRITNGVISLLDDIPKKMSLKNGGIVRLSKAVAVGSSDAQEAVKLEKIVGGKDTFLEVAWFARAMKKSKAVCRIIADKDDGSGKEAGTGWLIEGGYLITNHHVLKSPKMAATGIAQFDYEIDADTGQLKNLVAYKFDHSTWVADETLDVCRIKLIDNPAKPLAQWGILDTTEDDVPMTNEAISIIQHPEAGYKKVGLGEMLAQKGAFVWYDSPTLGGSSGSPIFNKDLRVFALHHAGVTKAFDGTGITKVANEGVLWSEIAKFLAKFPVSNPTKPSGKTEIGPAAGLIESTEKESGRFSETPKTAASNLPTIVILSDLDDETGPLKEFSKHLKMLNFGKPVCRLFYQNAGSQFGDVFEISKGEIESARFVLAVITPNFFNGAAGELLAFSMENRKTVVPVLVEKVPLVGTGLEKLKALPSNGQFILTDWKNASAGFSDVVENLRRAILNG